MFTSLPIIDHQAYNSKKKRKTEGEVLLLDEFMNTFCEVWEYLYRIKLETEIHPSQLIAVRIRNNHKAEVQP